MRKIFDARDNDHDYTFFEIRSEAEEYCDGIGISTDYIEDRDNGFYVPMSLFRREPKKNKRDITAQKSFTYSSIKKNNLKGDFYVLVHNNDSNVRKPIKDYGPYFRNKKDAEMSRMHRNNPDMYTVIKVREG